MEKHLNIPYAPSFRRNKLHELDLYVPPDASPSSSLIVFVHGGAWRTLRSPPRRSEDKADHALLARRLASLAGCTIAVPNYRLTTASTPDVRHPAHAADLLAALSFLLSWPGLPPSASSAGAAGVRLPRRPYDPAKVALVGHSCAAHMIASLVLDSGIPELEPHPPHRPGAPDLPNAVRAIACSEGIYDLDLQLASFPTHKDWFVAPAFGVRDSYADFSATHFPLRSSGSASSTAESTSPSRRLPKWLIIHSKGDTYVNLEQAQAMHAHLCKLYSDSDAEKYIATRWEEFDQQHDDVLLSEDFAQTVADFIKAEVK